LIAQSLTKQEKVFTLIGLLLSMFLAALDQTVVATAGPDIQRALHIDAGLYSWMTTAYLVASTVFVPLYGKLSDLLGRKPIILFGVSLFLVASILCGLSENTWQLLASRALQGVGSASVFTSAFAIVADLFPPRERGKYSGMFGAVFGISSLVGPLLGGFITDNFGWHWVFFINIPLGILALIFMFFKMPKLKPDIAKQKLDVAGVFILAIGVVPLLIGLSLGRPTLRPGEFGLLWTSPQCLGLLFTGIIGLAIFVWFELKIEFPLVNLRLFKDPLLSLGNGSVFLLGGVFLTPMVFLPLFMVNVVGVTNTASGLTISPLVLGVVAGNILSGQLVSRLGRYKLLMLVSLVTQLVGLFILATTLTAQSTQQEVTLKMVLLGLGMGPTIPLYTIAIQNAVAPKDIGSATSMMTFCRQMGASVGLAIVGSFFASSLSHELQTNIPAATAGLPESMVSRFLSSTPTSDGEGLGAQRFDAEKIKEKIADELQGARSVAIKAINGERLARSLVSSSQFASARLKEVAEAGGTNDAKERAEILSELDAALAAAKTRADAAVGNVSNALKLAFTTAIREVYWVAIVLAALALLLTVFLPERHLKNAVTPSATVHE
jgi:EmrB/QacA subfamily drug resistance transporter